MRPRTSKTALRLAVVTYLFAAGAASAEVPEPQTYWTGQMHSEVPATLTGARVIHAQEPAGILSEGKAIIDRCRRGAAPPGQSAAWRDLETGAA